MRTTAFLTALVVFATIHVIVADLPIHCLHQQVIRPCRCPFLIVSSIDICPTQALGEWEFFLGPGTGDSSERCGYDSPDDNVQHFTNYNYRLQGVPQQIRVRRVSRLPRYVTCYFTRTATCCLVFDQIKLSEPNLAQIVGTDVRGTWTMVYDEGFEVTINGQVVRRIVTFLFVIIAACLMSSLSLRVFVSRPVLCFFRVRAQRGALPIEHQGVPLHLALRPQHDWLVPHHSQHQLGLLPSPKGGRGCVDPSTVQPQGQANIGGGRRDRPGWSLGNTGTVEPDHVCPRYAIHRYCQPRQLQHLDGRCANLFSRFVRRGGANFAWSRSFCRQIGAASQGCQNGARWNLAA
jgi:hypothetical protein